MDCGLVFGGLVGGAEKPWARMVMFSPWWIGGMVDWWNGDWKMWWDMVVTWAMLEWGRAGDDGVRNGKGIGSGPAFQ